MKKEYENYKVIQLEYEGDKYSKVNNSWDTVGVKDKYICPECQYLGRICDKCGGGF